MNNYELINNLRYETENNMAKRVAEVRLFDNIIEDGYVIGEKFVDEWKIDEKNVEYLEEICKENNIYIEIYTFNDLD